MFGFVNQVDSIKVIFTIFLKPFLRFFFLGKGIYLVRDIDELKEKFSEIEALDRRKQVLIKPNKRIIQRFDFFFQFLI
jgi:hypothetical protein